MKRKIRKAFSIVECAVALSILIVLSSTVVATLVPLKSMSKTASGDNIAIGIVYDMIETFQTDAWVASNEKNVDQEEKNIKSLGLYFYKDATAVFKPKSNNFSTSWASTNRYTVEYSFPFDKDVRYNPDLVLSENGEYDYKVNARYVINCTVEQQHNQRSIFISAVDAMGDTVCEMDRCFVRFDIVI